MNTIQALNWRYATKKFDTTKKLSVDQLMIVEEALRLSASSFGLQPWKFFIVSNPEIRAKLREAGYGQPQITDASHLVVFTVPTNLDEAFVDRYLKLLADVKSLPTETLAIMGGHMKGKVASMTPAESIAWSARQAYIALGTLLTILANESIDACPMEGFDNAKFDEILGLRAMNLTSVAIAAVGFRSADDATAVMPKARFPKSEVIVEVQ